jgi:hypothetical protein
MFVTKMKLDVTMDLVELIKKIVQLKSNVQMINQLNVVMVTVELQLMNVNLLNVLMD